MTKNLLSVALGSFVLLGLTSSPAAAVPLQCSDLTQNLAAYVTAGSCLAGDKLFSNFVFNFTGGTSNNTVTQPLVPSSNQVAVDLSLGALVPGGPSSVGLEFDFSGAANKAQVANNQTMDLQIQYLVQVEQPIGFSASISGISGSLTGSAQTGVASALFEKDDCTGNGGGFSIGAGNTPTGSCIGGSKGDLGSVAGSTSGIPLVDGTASFSQGGLNLTQAGVFDEIQLAGGGGTTGATITAEASNITNTFAESYQSTRAPEPATMVLFGSALIGLGIFGRKRASR